MGCKVGTQGCALRLVKEGVFSMPHHLPPKHFSFPSQNNQHTFNMILPISMLSSMKFLQPKSTKYIPIEENNEDTIEGAEPFWLVRKHHYYIPILIFLLSTAASAAVGYRAGLAQQQRSTSIQVHRVPSITSGF